MIFFIITLVGLITVTIVYQLLTKMKIVGGNELGIVALTGNDLRVLENVKIIVDDNNRIIEIDESNKEIKNNVVLIPGLFNAHVHAADIGLRGKAFGSLNELIGKGGIKHGYLKNRKGTCRYVSK